MSFSANNMNAAKRRIKLYSLNTKGLNIPEKRSKLLLLLKKSGSDIIFLQETHFKTDNYTIFTDKYFPHILHATNSDSKSKGVSILISKHCPIQILDTKVDREGRFLFIKGTLYNQSVTLANIYAPNRLHAPFFTDIIESLELFASGLVILGGDFNLTMNPLLDTSSGSSKTPYRTLNLIKKLLHRLSLHDSWRTMNPSSKDYTFYSPPHNSYSRLDYFYISQNGLELLDNTSIDPMILSDHNPITMCLSIEDKPLSRKPWRLDNSLLNDKNIIRKLDSAISYYFKENSTSDVHPPTLWLAHKCVLRGELISLLAKRNKDRRERIKLLTDRIEMLERSHKRSLASDVLAELTTARNELLQILEEKIKRNKVYLHKFFYEYGNKTGRLLANSLNASNKKFDNIHSINDPTGKKLTCTSDITRQFQKFYSNLYNLRDTTPKFDSSSRRSMITDFLSSYCPKPIDPKIAKDLDKPLETGEALRALKQLNVGKSPGPDGFSVDYFKTFKELLIPHFIKAFDSDPTQ